MSIYAHLTKQEANVLSQIAQSQTTLSDCEPFYVHPMLASVAILVTCCEDALLSTFIHCRCAIVRQAKHRSLLLRLPIVCASLALSKVHAFCPEARTPIEPVIWYLA